MTQTPAHQPALHVYERRAHVSVAHVQFVSASPEEPAECRNGCVYCYSPYVSPVNRFQSIDHMMQALKHNKDRYDMIGQGCEQEMFTNQARAVEMMKMWASLGKIILFSTKENLTDETIEALVNIDTALRQHGSYLFAQSSFVSGRERKDLEPRAPSVYERIDTLKRLSAAGIYASAFIKPLLPESIVPIDDIFELVDRTAEFTDCYVVGAFYFEQHLLRKMNLLKKISSASWKKDVEANVALEFLAETASTNSSNDPHGPKGLKDQEGSDNDLEKDSDKVRHQRRFFRYFDERRVDRLVGYIKLQDGIAFTKTTPAVLSFRS